MKQLPESIKDLSITEALEAIEAITEIFGSQGCNDTESLTYNGMIGKYVIVRCRDAGVHAGVLVWQRNRECVLQESRRLYRWRAGKSAFLSGVARYGIVENDSMIGAETTDHLTENCEIIECSELAEHSIREAKEYEPS